MVATDCSGDGRGSKSGEREDGVEGKSSGDRPVERKTGREKVRFGVGERKRH